MRKEDTQFVEDLLDTEGPRIFGIGPTHAYLQWVSYELRDRVKVARVRDRGLRLELEDGREIILRSPGTNWMRGYRVDAIVEHPAVWDKLDPHQYRLMHNALRPCLIH